jgi:hypothetical protein
MIYEAIHVCIARIAGFLWGVGSDRSDRNLQEDFISPAGLVLGIASTPLTRASSRNKNREDKKLAHRCESRSKRYQHHLASTLAPKEKQRLKRQNTSGTPSKWWLP